MPTQGWSIPPQRAGARPVARILLMLAIGGALLASLLAVGLLPLAAQSPAAPAGVVVIEGCYAVADEDAGGGQPDTLVRLNPDNGVYSVIGGTGTQGIEAIAFGPSRNLYAINGNFLGTLDFTSGAFTPFANPIGTGNGSEGAVTLNNVDGLTYSLNDGVFYASHRREGTANLPDLLFAIDPATRAFVPNYFGPGVDYVVVPAVIDPTTQQELIDIDDLAVNPVTDELLAAMNTGGTGGVLVSLDKTTGIPTPIATFRYPNPYPANPALAGTVVDDVEGLAYGNDGQLYGSTGTNGPNNGDLNQLFAINDANGLAVSLGSLQPTAADPQDFEALDCLSAESAIALKKYTNGPGQPPEDADAPTGPHIVEGETVTWTYIFTNTGYITLTDLVLVDDKVGAIGPGGLSNCPPAGTILPPGDSFTCTGTGVAQLGQYANTAVVTGVTEVGAVVPRQTVTDTDPSHYLGHIVEGPDIVLKKYTNGADADLPNGPDVPQLQVGDPVLWTYVFTNTGTVALNNLILTDDILGEIGPNGVTGTTCPIGGITLQPGETFTCSATGIAELGLYANMGIITGTSVSQTPAQVTDRDPSHYIASALEPGIAIRKYTNGFDANGINGSDAPAIDAPGVGGATGDITWTYQVTNTGQISFPVASVVVTDSLEGPVTQIIDQGDGDAFLEPGEVWWYQKLGTAVALPVTPGPGQETGCVQHGSPRTVYVNTGTVAVVGSGLTDSDPSRYCNQTPTNDPETEEPANPRANALFLPLVGKE